mgnify:CR=1 FL=1
MCCESRLDDREVVGPAYVLYEKATETNKNQRNQQKPTKNHLQKAMGKNKEA